MLSSEKGCSYKTLGGSDQAVARSVNELFIIDGCSNQTSFWTRPKYY